MATLSWSQRKRWRQRLLSVLLILAIIGLPAIAAPPVVMAQGPTFQVGVVSDATGPYLTFPFEIESGAGGPPGGQPPPEIDAAMTAVIDNIVVLPGAGAIGGDAIEFDVIITNTSDPTSNAILTAYAFQAKFS